jgi:Family of unknown function (DUF6599)
MGPQVTGYRPPTDEPVFNTFRRKPLRPFYSLREVQIGLLIIALLAAVTGWITWRGAHVDPTLFAPPGEKLLTDKGKNIVVYKRPLEPWHEPGSGSANASVRLEPFPDSVVSPGWRVTAAPQMFDEPNVYEKIDGREEFYKARGFKKLYFLSLASDAQPNLNVDIELFDLGSIENALSALSAEVSNPQVEAQATPAGLWYVTRNGGFLSQGRYYARIIGSDDSDAIRQKIAGLRDGLIAGLPAEPMPWVYGLFVGKLHLNPGKIQFQKENAFSFDFATEVYSASIPGSDAEIFISKRPSADEATAFANKMADGFAGFGKRIEAGLIHNEYVNAYDGVRTQGSYVIGVRLAPTTAEATQWLDKLSKELGS